MPALVVLGRSRRGAGARRAAYAAHQRSAPAELADPSIHLVGQLFAGREAGPIAEVTGLAEMILGVSVELGSTLGQAYFGVQLGGARFAAGRVRSAAAAFDESAMFIRELAQPGGRWSLAGAAQAYALAGTSTWLTSAARRAGVAADSRRSGCSRVEIARASAWAAVGHGTISQARAIPPRALDDSRADRPPASRCELPPPRPRPPRFARSGRGARRRAPRRAQGQFAAARATTSPHSPARTGDALDGAADARSPRWAPTCSRCGRRRPGRRGPPRRRPRATGGGQPQPGAGARRHLRGCIHPGLATLVTSTLTGREREIAQLAAGGLGNRAIAEQLFVSLRTVENHLQHVYVKLGVDGRRELASVLASVRDLSTAHYMT